MSETYNREPLMRTFNSSNPEWRHDEEFNRMYLQMQEKYFNHLLQRDGFLFLNDVYQALGYPRTKEGQLVGWMRESDGATPIDGFVDIGIISMDNGTFLLEFNVDGNILEVFDAN